MARFRLAFMKWLGLLCATLAWGCDKTPPPEANLGEYTQQVHDRLTALQAKMDALNSAIQRFDYDDWKDVVPDVEAAAQEVDAGIQSLAEEWAPLETSASEIAEQYIAEQEPEPVIEPPY